MLMFIECRLFTRGAERTEHCTRGGGAGTREECCCGNTPGNGRVRRRLNCLHVWNRFFPRRLPLSLSFSLLYLDTFLFLPRQNETKSQLVLDELVVGPKRKSYMHLSSEEEAARCDRHAEGKASFGWLWTPLRPRGKHFAEYIFFVSCMKLDLIFFYVFRFIYEYILYCIVVRVFQWMKNI